MKVETVAWRLTCMGLIAVNGTGYYSPYFCFHAIQMLDWWFGFFLFSEILLHGT